MDDFQTIANLTGCRPIISFSQNRLFKFDAASIANTIGHSGMCWGLAMVWLSYHQKGMSHSFFRHLPDWKRHSALLKSSALSELVQKKPDNIAQAANSCGLRLAGDWCDPQLQLEDLSARNPDDMLQLHTMVISGFGRRYYFLQTNTHAMAIFVSTFGRIEFFDPNFGVMETFSRRSFINFLTRFFSSYRICNGYWRGSGRALLLTITKLKSL